MGARTSARKMALATRSPLTTTSMRDLCRQRDGLALVICVRRDAAAAYLSAPAGAALTAMSYTASLSTILSRVAWALAPLDGPADRCTKRRASTLPTRSSARSSREGGNIAMVTAECKPIEAQPAVLFWT